MNLYEIPSAYASLMDAIEEADGELTPDMEQELATIEGTLQDKAQAICCLVRNASVEAEVYRHEARRLTEKARVAEHREARLKELLLHAMRATGTTKLSGDLFQIRLQKSARPKIRWQGDPEDLPGWCRRETVELDGTRAQERFEAGASMEGFEVSFAEFLVIR